MDIADHPVDGGAPATPTPDTLQSDDGWWGLEAALPFLLPGLTPLPDGPLAAA